MQELINWILFNAEKILILIIVSCVFFFVREIWRELEKEYWAISHKIQMLEYKIRRLENEKE